MVASITSRISGVSPTFWLGFAALALLAATTYPSIGNLFGQWQTNEAHSHGFVVLLISGYLALVALGDPAIERRSPSLWFLPALIVSLLVVVEAGTSGLHVLVHYGILAAVCSLVVATRGWDGLRVLAIPLLLLFLAIPLPSFFEVNLTIGLKLLSSQLGAAILYELGVPVLRDGNIIDLGLYRLHIADACAGLNYMFPLMAIGVMIAGLLRTTLWRRVAVVLMTIPITVAMNVVRIVITGLLVRYVGPETAQGFIHDFEGWLVFMCSLLLILPLTALLLRIGPNKSTLGNALVLDLTMPSLARPVGEQHAATSRRNLVIATLLVATSFAVTLFLKERSRIEPTRAEFADFPTLVGDWLGLRSPIDIETVFKLKMSDYLLANYRSPGHSQPVELYASYYATQTQGSLPHSPEICIPGSGWEIVSIERTDVAIDEGVTIPLNRALIQKDDAQSLVYYWFHQRGRVFASEFAMKWYIFQDAVAMNRTDGALIRLTTPIGDSTTQADARLQAFIRDAWAVLPAFIPGRGRQTL